MINSKSAKLMITSAAKLNKSKAEKIKRRSNYGGKQIHNIFEIKNGNCKGFRI